MKQTNLEWLTEKGKAASGIAATKFTELMVSGEDAVENAYIEYLKWLAAPHVEPITLTAEERKAVQLCVDIGLPWISVTNYYKISRTEAGNFNESYGIEQMPNVKILCKCLWITEKPIDLRTLL